VLFAVAVLFVNDHFLKRAWPGSVTGKLSDVAGMFFFPLLLHAVASNIVPRSRRSDVAHDRLLFVCCAATAFVFVLAKTTIAVNEAYAVTLGALQWPFRALASLAHERAVSGVRPVILARDPSDVLAVPFVALAYVAGRARCAHTASTPARCGTAKQGRS
jgi:hypothetical protein